MGTRTTTINEPDARDLEDIRITVSKDTAGDADGIHISYTLKDDQGNRIGAPRHIHVPFADLTGPQKTTLRNVVAWAVAQVVATEGPFV